MSKGGLFVLKVLFCRFPLDLLQAGGNSSSSSLCLPRFPAYPSSIDLDRNEGWGIGSDEVSIC